jgi:hypothetical protein
MTAHALPPHRLWDDAARCFVRCDPSCHVDHEGISDCHEFACPDCGASVVHIEEGLEPVGWCEDCGSRWAA